MHEPNFLFLCLIFFSKYNQIKNLAYFVNIQKPLGKPIIAMFYTRCCTLAFSFRKLASVGKDILFCNFWCSVWLQRIANVYGFQRWLISLCSIFYLIVFSRYYQLIQFQTQKARNFLLVFSDSLFLKFPKCLSFLLSFYQ